VKISWFILPPSFLWQTSLIPFLFLVTRKGGGG
jgi:hypothetical protein